MINHSREDIVSLLKLGQQHKAFHRVEQLLKDQNRISAYKEIDSFCQCIFQYLSCTGDQISDLPTDVNVAVSSLVFAASRCGELPELNKLRNEFKDWYGDKFVYTNIHLLSGNLVSNQIKQALCTCPISEDLKHQLIRNIAREHNVHVSIGATKKDVTAKSKDKEAFSLHEEENIEYGQEDEFLDFTVRGKNKVNADVLENKLPKNVLTMSFNSFALISPPPGSSCSKKWYVNLKAEEQLSARTSSASNGEIREREIVYLDDINGKTPTQTYPKSTDVGKAQGSRRSAMSTRYAKVGGEGSDLFLGYVHPKLPDYEDLVAKFKEIKTGYVAGRKTM
ncbi:hypothetical protein Dimus_012588 [Dionaea muscipula]